MYPLLGMLRAVRHRASRVHRIQIRRQRSAIVRCRRPLGMEGYALTFDSAKAMDPFVKWRPWLFGLKDWLGCDVWEYRLPAHFTRLSTHILLPLLTMASTEDKDVRIRTIRTVLNLYPFSIGIFREILQNSEDAKASKQVELVRHTFCSTC